MSAKISWIDNLRAIACLMVIIIHTTTWYISGPQAVADMRWDIANVLNSASRCCVPIFFMISGYLFFGERAAQGRHFLRIVLCLVFYSGVALAYITWMTPISQWQAVSHLFQRPVFYHLWFFFAIIGIYLFSPLIQVRQVSAKYVAILVVIIAILANPNTIAQSVGRFHWIPVNLYVSGDTIYYLLYALLGRAIGVMNTQYRAVTCTAILAFIGSVVGIILGTRQLLEVNGAFNDTWYLYCGPFVFIAALSLLIFSKNCLNRGPLPGLKTIAKYSLPIYGFHALFIHYLRTNHYDFMQQMWIDLPWVLAITLGGSLLLSMGLARIDKRHFVT